jgi:hypothetical protein
VSEEIERAVERKPSDHYPEARSETNSGQSGKDGETGDFTDEAVAAPRHHSKQDVERAYYCQDGRIEGPVAVVANGMREYRHDHSEANANERCHTSKLSLHYEDEASTR